MVRIIRLHTNVGQHGQRGALEIEPVDDKLKLDLGVNRSSKRGELNFGSENEVERHLCFRESGRRWHRRRIERKLDRLSDCRRSSDWLFAE